MIIEGHIIKQIYRNEETSFSIYVLSLETGEEVIIKGVLPKLTEDLLYEFEVDEVNHPQYGLQYDVKSFKQAATHNREGLISYLSSDLFFGVGIITATRIVDTFGTEAIDIILEDKNVLKRIGFNALQIERFYQALYKNQKLDKVLVDLFSYGLRLKISMKLIDFYGYDVVEVIKENPYRLMYDIENIGFLRADAIAKKIGIQDDDPKRVEAAIVYSINEYINSSGHTYLNEKNLLQAINKILNTDELKEEINTAKENLISKNIIYVEDNNYTLAQVKKTEENLAKQLLRFTNKKRTNVNLDDLIAQVEKINRITYTVKQKEAINEAINNPLTVITGGPGTGKTTVLLGILSVYALYKGINIRGSSVVDNVGVCAPTGRAARRMSDLIGIPAFTIHRLLGYGYDRTFMYDEENQLPQALFIIDEASMIDIYLAENLFKSIPNNAQVVIVGDKDQLPSVGPGQVLADIISSGRAPTIVLDEIHRQSLDSGIIKLANDVNNQTINSESYEAKEDLIFIKEDSKEIVKTLIELTTQALENGYDLIEDIQVLIPMYNGSVGINTVNQMFQSHFHKKEEVHVERNLERFYIGDKVMHLVNSPEKGVMNGDIGKIISIYSTKENEKIVLVSYQEGEVPYNLNELEELTLAYAISIHKSQGSEYKTVFIPLVRSYKIMLRKELLYTAITRAKNHLYLIGEIDLISYASGKINEKRQTKLKEYLLEEKEDLKEKKKELTPYDFM